MLWTMITNTILSHQSYLFFIFNFLINEIFIKTEKNN